MPRDEFLRKKREAEAERRAADPEGHRKKQRDFYAANLVGNRKKNRDYYARRFFWGRAMKLRGPDRATTQQLASLWKSQRGLCALTGWPMDRTAQVDHVTPKAVGGTDEIANLRWVCAVVNMAKRDLTDPQFMAVCVAVVLRGRE